VDINTQLSYEKGDRKKYSLDFSHPFSSPLTQTHLIFISLLKKKNILKEEKNEEERREKVVVM